MPRDGPFVTENPRRICVTPGRDWGIREWADGLEPVGDNFGGPEPLAEAGQPDPQGDAGDADLVRDFGRGVTVESQVEDAALGVVEVGAELVEVVAVLGVGGGVGSGARKRGKDAGEVVARAVGAVARKSTLP